MNVQKNMAHQYQAVVVEKTKNKAFNLAVQQVDLPELKAEQLLVRVHYSSINFKDLLSCAGNPAITRRFPHIPGIDAVGVVAQSTSEHFQQGDSVLVFCCAMGMTSNGGFAEYVQVPASWALKIDESWSKEHMMAFGTAGFTAAMCVEQLQQHIALADADVVVTGATGGVGCVATALLAKLGANVTAVTGQAKQHGFLSEIGAEQVVNRADLLAKGQQNLLPQQWHAAVDVAGGQLLNAIIKQMHNNGVVTACGNADDTQLTTNMLPFILRGVSLIGINAEYTTAEYKMELWRKLVEHWLPSHFEKLYRVVSLSELLSILQHYHQNKPIGRIVVKLI